MQRGSQDLHCFAWAAVKQASAGALSRRQGLSVSTVMQHRCSQLLRCHCLLHMYSCSKKAPLWYSRIGVVVLYYSCLELPICSVGWSRPKKASCWQNCKPIVVSASSMCMYSCCPHGQLLADSTSSTAQPDMRGPTTWHCCCVMLSGSISTARSAEFLLPRKLSQLVLQEGMELGAADDKLFGRTNSGQGSGTVGHLTNNIVTRSYYYEHAITMALIPFLNPDLYPGYCEAL